jgi:broad specificity phosphatase PhoE
MTVCFLVRHAAFDFGVHHLAGRSECALSPAGEDQAAKLTRVLPKKAVFQSSPRRRCLQTIAPHAFATGRRATVIPALDEMDFGSWTGRTFASLDRDSTWREWNEKRAESRAPGGESMLEAQSRILGHIRNVAADNPSSPVIMVTHAELIRAVVLHCLSLPLDDWKLVDVPYASVTTIAVGPSGQIVLDQRIAA